MWESESACNYRKYIALRLSPADGKLFSYRRNSISQIPYVIGTVEGAHLIYAKLSLKNLPEIDPLKQARTIKHESIVCRGCLNRVERYRVSLHDMTSSSLPYFVHKQRSSVYFHLGHEQWILSFTDACAFSGPSDPTENRYASDRRNTVSPCERQQTKHAGVRHDLSPMSIRLRGYGKTIL